MVDSTAAGLHSKAVVQDSDAAAARPRSPNISALLRGPHSAFIAELHRGLSAAGYADIHPAHYVVFQHLRNEGSRLTDLAERAQITKQLMNYLVNHLEGRGYLQRVPDPTDGRARLVRFTEQGRGLERAAEESISRIEAEWEARLGARRMAQLRRILTCLADTLQTPQ
jgi:DNA-binding MarR family transcriptional regulator